MSERRPPGGPPGDGGLPEGLGDLLQPEAHELGALPGPRPAWMERVATETLPLAAEQARLQARVVGTMAQEGRGWWRPVAVGLTLVAVLALLLLSPTSREPLLLPEGVLVAVAPDTPVALSEAITASGGVLLTIVERDEERVQTELHSGQVVFEVDPELPVHDLLVHMGQLTLQTQGARVLLDRRGQVVEVAVFVGAATVRWPAGEVALSAGERWSGNTGIPSEPASDGVIDVEPAGQGTPVGSPSEGDDPRGGGQEAKPERSEAPQGDGGEPAPDQAPAARAWLEVVNAQEAGESPEALLGQVDAFLAAWPDSALVSEAELLRLELWSVHHDPHAAIAILEHWLATHPVDERRPQVLLLHGSVAAGRLQDCGRARASLLALVEGEAGELRDLAMGWLAACDGAPEP